MDAAKTSDDPGAASSPVIDFNPMNFLLPDDFSGISKPFHRLIDVIAECMTAETGKLKEKYVAAIETYEGRVVTWAAEKKALEAEKEALNAELLEARTGKNDLTAKMKERDQRISKYESCAAELQVVDTKEFSDKIQSLWEKFKELTAKYFLVDLSTDLFDQTRWDPFIVQLGLKRGTPPLPARNSEPAKKARVAAALAVIASLLASRIFTPFYFYRPTENDDFKELLIRLAEDDYQKELMCRALLLSQWTEGERREAEEGLVKEVTDAVTRRLAFWIDGITLNAFRRELLDLFKEAVELWRQTQNSTSKFDATVDDIDEPIWGVLSGLNNDDDDPPEDSQARSAILALFPRVRIVGEDEDETLFNGIGLWAWQVAAAEQELREDMEAKGRPKRGRRKMSNNVTGSAVSSTKLRGAAFLGRAKTEQEDGTG